MPSGVYVRTVEIRKAISISKTGCKYPNRKKTQKHSEETRKKMSKARIGNKYHLGIKHSKETLEKMRGRVPWNKGLIGFMTGEKSPRWIKDRTQLAKQQERNDMAYKEWRKSVKNRDGWKCKIENQDCSGKIIVHHILGWSSYPELRYEINNGITLCQAHHPRKRNDEIKLSPYFTNLVSVKVN